MAAENGVEAVDFYSRSAVAVNDVGDGVVIHPPVYTPFRTVVEGNNRKVIENPLIFDGESYTMDLDGLRSVVAEHKPKMMVLWRIRGGAGSSR